MTAPYRVRNPQYGVTDVFHSELANRSRAGSSPADSFSGGVYFAAAEMLALQGHVLSALRAAERGMALGAPDPEAQALYAWLLYRRDGGSASRVSANVWQQLDDALARNSECALAHYFKSVLLQRSGRSDEARWHLRRGRELDTKQSEADRALALLDDE